MATTLGCSFEMGNSERILNRQSSQLQYPLLWLEYPEVGRQRNGQLMREWHGAFLFLTDKSPDDYAGQNSALDEMLTLTEQALGLMQTDAEATPPTFLFNQDEAESQYKGKWSADDDWGWRTEFTLKTPICECEDCP